MNIAEGGFPGRANASCGMHFVRKLIWLNWIHITAGLSGRKSAALWVKSLDGELKALQNLCRTQDVSSVAREVMHAWHLPPRHGTGRKESEKDM